MRDRRKPLLSPNDRIMMYRSYPSALEEELQNLFQIIAGEEARAQHNTALVRIIAIYPDGDMDTLLRNVARAIIQTAQMKKET